MKNCDHMYRIKKTIVIIIVTMTYSLSLFLTGCQTDPLPTPIPDEEPCELVCDSCPPQHNVYEGWFQYFETPIVKYGLIHHPSFTDTVHAIFIPEDCEDDTIGFVNEDIIPDCLRSEEKTHVKVCCMNLLGLFYMYNHMEELYCIKRIDD